MEHQPAVKIEPQRTYPLHPSGRSLLPHLIRDDVR
jgi:hypothetical protein